MHVSVQVTLVLLSGCCIRVFGIAFPSLLAPSSEASYCCVRHDWEALMYIDFGTVFIDQNTAFSYINGTVKAAYSLSQKKIFFKLAGIEQSPLIPKPVPYDAVMLYDFANGTMYLVSGGECQKDKLEANMTLQCIPRSAKQFSSGVFGTGQEVLHVHTYQFTLASDVPWQITATVFTNDIKPIEPRECGIITVSYFAPSVNPDSGSLYTLNVMDVGEIKTPGIFDVPKECL
ncbi:uncharacterized protein LOC127867640 [Dreissena polymorpha]|uniref:Uncharacterized protein n=1 Tax=Dreissena polymorpha TaxID=45954 RepID=A0A9D4RGN2_DREPO|nr:uncharacterized protein LOC127867640 [Dreissena polymorpha]KAH3867826.1 hypothetical protein DPMN_030963 [Dreissena polymorpha]